MILQVGGYGEAFWFDDLRIRRFFGDFFLSSKNGGGHFFGDARWGRYFVDFVVSIYLYCNMGTDE